MKIKILVSCAGLSFSFAEGETADVKEELAKDLIKAGYAEEIKPTSARKTKADTVKEDVNADT